MPLSSGDGTLGGDPGEKIRLETRKKGRKEGKRSRKRRCSLTLTDRQNREKKNEKEIRWTDEKRWKTDGYR